VSAEITVSVASDELTVPAGTTAGQLLLEQRGLPAKGPHAVVVAKVGGELCDLAHQLTDGDVVEPVSMDSPDGLAVLRHSTAHVLAQAVQRANPKASLGIGPPVRDGFYYDFDVDTPFTPDDVKAMSRSTMRHRIALRPEVELEGGTADGVLDGLLATVPVPR